MLVADHWGHLRGLDFDEACAAGAEGLLDAAARFDPHRGVRSFLTFARPRVWGAVADHMRRRFGRGRTVQVVPMSDLLAQM